MFYLTKIIPIESRKEYIACAQLIAQHIPEDMLDGFLALNSGDGSSGKSLNTMAFGAQLMPLRTSDASFIGTATWTSEDKKRPLRMHFRDAVDNNVGAPEFEKIDPQEFRAELEEEGNIIFLQNYPEDFREIADIGFHTRTIGNPDDWKRSQSISIFNERLMADTNFMEFLINLDQDQIKAAAALIPDNYLMPDGNIYDRVIG